MSKPNSTALRFGQNVIVDSPDHTAAPGMWSYACRCLRCRWEQWWHEGDNSVCPMPDEPHPDGEYADYFADQDEWSGWSHPNG
jgi:hypothetical protein